MSPGDGSQMKVVKVPVLDTGLGREAGYADDAAMIEAAKAQRRELESLLTPEAVARLDAADAEIDRRFLFGR